MPGATPDRHDSGLPRPFYTLPWWGSERRAAQALWHWHTALTDPKAPLLDEEGAVTFFEAQQRRAAAGEPLKVVDEAIWRAAYDACDGNDLPTALLARQVGAARHFKRDRLAFETAADLDAFLRHWALPHGLLMARLAEAGHAWQERAVFELARGFFLTGRLLRLPQDIRAGRLFIPLVELDQHEVTERMLREGPPQGDPPSENTRRLLWKQAVRARDALAQGQEALVRELPRRHAYGLRCYWLGALDVLDQLEGRRFDVWHGPPLRLGYWRRTQVYLQAFLGRSGR